MSKEAYTAGIIDGEGTIKLQHQRARNPVLYIPTVLVTSTSFELPEWLKENWGGWLSEIQPRSPKGTENCRKALVWTLQGSDKVLILVKAIQPYVLVKRAHTNLMIDFLTTGEVSQPPKPISETELLRRQLYFQQFTELNKRGTK